MTKSLIDVMDDIDVVMHLLEVVAATFPDNHPDSLDNSRQYIIGVTIPKMLERIQEDLHEL